MKQNNLISHKLTMEESQSCKICPKYGRYPFVMTIFLFIGAVVFLVLFLYENLAPKQNTDINMIT